MMNQEPSIANPTVVREIRLGESVEEISKSILNGLANITALREDIAGLVSEDFRKNGNIYYERRKAENVIVNEVEERLESIREALNPLFILHILKKKQFMGRSNLYESIRDSFEPYYRDYFGAGNGFGVYASVRGSFQVDVYISRDRSAAFAQRSYTTTDRVIENLVSLGVVEETEFKIPRGIDTYHNNLSHGGILATATNFRLTEKGRKLAAAVFSNNSGSAELVSELVKSTAKPVSFYSGIWRCTDFNPLPMVLYVAQNPGSTLEAVMINTETSWGKICDMHDSSLIDVRLLKLRGGAQVAQVFPTNDTFKFLKQKQKELRQKRIALEATSDQISEVTRKLASRSVSRH